MKSFGQFFAGYVRVRLTGLSPERFFNLCGTAGLELWNIAYKGEVYEFNIRSRDFLKCGPFAKKAMIRLRILEKFGLPFFLHKNRHRTIWGAGLICFFILLGVMSLFVWDIEYRGNVTYTDDELTHFLESLQITCGMKKNDISCEELEEQLRNNFEGITWVSAQLRGTRLYLHIKENEVPLVIPVKDETPSDLVASSDGVITSMIVRSGIAMVSPGETVTKGQLLVSGRVPITDDSGTVVSEHLVHADADIIGKITRTEIKEFSMWHKKEMPTGNLRKGLYINISGQNFAWLLPNFRHTQWKTITQVQRLCLFGDFCLPVDYGLITSYEVSVYDEKYTEKELSEMAEQYKSEVSEKLMEKGVQIIENNVRILVNDSLCRFEAVLMTEEPIEERSKIN